MRLFKRLLLVGLSITLLVGCDLTSKKIAETELKNQPVKAYLNGGLQFVYAENEGGMLSFGGDLSETTRIIIFQVFVGAMLALFLAYFIKKKNSGRLETLAFVLFFSGGLGNLFSRITHDGRVVDFMIIELSGYHTGIFNVADVYIMLSMALLIFLLIISPGKARRVI